jgi:CubicO group peptidase (beta-lactamase class C family)
MVDFERLTKPEEVGLSTRGLEKIDDLVRSHIDQGALSGAVTLVARHGKVVHLGVMGVKDIASAEPMRADTMFRIFSMTKPVTATAMMILHDQGLWSADDPIAKHLPEFADVKVYSAGGDGDPFKLVEPLHAPTIGELLTHGAGFGYGFAFGETTDPIELLYREARIWEAPNLAEMMARLGKMPLAYQPGSMWRYSLSMDVQGAMIERLTGMTLPDFTRQRIFEPLGMIDTAFHTPPEKRDRLATLYFKADGFPPVQMENPLLAESDSPPSLASGGGGLYSTASDYARYAQILLSGGAFEGRRIVSREGVRAQMTNRLPDTMLQTGFGIGHQRLRPGFGYGYNGVVFTDPKLAGVPVGKGTYHWDGAAGTWFWVDPQNDLLFVGMIQSLAINQLPLQPLSQTLMADAIL